MIPNKSVMTDWLIESMLQVDAIQTDFWSLLAKINFYAKRPMPKPHRILSSIIKRRLFKPFSAFRWSFMDS